MAQFHESISILGRSGGRCSVQMAAYISGDKLYDERTGQTFDNTSKEEVIYSGMTFADKVPDDIRDISSFWNAVEQNEKNENAQLARVMDIALPIELNQEHSKELCDKYVRAFIDNDNIPAVQYAIHWKKDNPHIHVMMPLRDIDDNGKWKVKQKRERKLTERGDKIPVLDEEKLKEYEKNHEKKFDLKKIDDELYKNYPDKDERDKKRQEILDEVQKLRVRQSRGTVERKWEDHIVERNPWDDRSMVTKWRSRWAEFANEALEMAGFDERIDHRSYADRGIDKIPTIHEGYAARKMGDLSERVQQNQAIQEANERIQELSRNIIEEQSLLEKLIRAFEEFIQEVSHHGISRTIANRIARLGSHSDGRADGSDPGRIRVFGAEEPGFAAEAVRAALNKQRADEENARAERADREAEAERLRIEAERAEQERIRAEQERMRENLTKSRKAKLDEHSNGPTLRG